MQDWVHTLTFMKQAVLLTAVRGPDGLPKNHISKVFNRWLRRCILIRAFEKDVCWDPYASGGGSFTGPCTLGNVFPDAQLLDKLDPTWSGTFIETWPHRWRGYTDQRTPLLDAALKKYLEAVDEIPHHFQLHFMHAAQLLGTYHPDKEVSDWWQYCYLKIVGDAHLQIESIADMEKRLGDNEEHWRAAEEVTAR